MRTGPQAGIASDAFCFIPGHFACGVEIQRPNRACFDTCTAADAHIDRFRVMAETAIKRTSLKKDGGPV